MAQTVLGVKFLLKSINILIQLRRYSDSLDTLNPQFADNMTSEP